MGKTKDKIRTPITKGAAKVPVVMQMEALECGAASLTMILAYYGKWIPLEQVRADCGVSRDGSNAKNVLKAARSYGLVAKGYRYEPDELKKNGKFPCIIHWNFNHFVVLDGFKGNKAVLNDPAKGTYSVPMETFDNSSSRKSQAALTTVSSKIPTNIIVNKSENGGHPCICRSVISRS